MLPSNGLLATNTINSTKRPGLGTVLGQLQYLTTTIILPTVLFKWCFGGDKTTFPKAAAEPQLVLTTPVNPQGTPCPT